MRKYAVLFFLIGSCVSLFIPAAYGGYYNNYQYLIGDRAAGMGGAYAAAADDGSALWYNPAGLANINMIDISLSGNAYNYLQTETKGYVEFENPDYPGEYDQISLNESDISAAATTLVLGKKMGNAGTFAIGIFVPYQDNLRGSMEGEVQSSETITYVQVQFHDQSKYLVGMLGWGKRFLDRLNLGASVSCGHYSGSYEESEYFFDQWDFSADPPLSGNYTYRYTEEYEYILAGASAGVQLNINDRNIIGARVVSPMYAVSGSDKYTNLNLSTRNDGEEPEYDLEKVKEDADPFEVILPEIYTIGYSYCAPQIFSFSLDLEYIGTSDGSSDSALNVKTGLEFFLTEDLILRAGFFTDFSQDGDVDEDTESENYESIDYYGGTFSLTFGSRLSICDDAGKAKEQKSWTTAGIVYRRGIGDILTESYDNNIELSNRVKRKTVDNYSLFVSETISY